MISTIWHNKGTPQSISRERETVQMSNVGQVRSPRVRGGCDDNRGVWWHGDPAPLVTMCDVWCPDIMDIVTRGVWLGPRTAADAGSGSGPVPALIGGYKASHWAGPEIWGDRGERGETRPVAARAQTLSRHEAGPGGGASLVITVIMSWSQWPSDQW